MSQMESLFNIIQLVTVFLLINTSSSILNEKNSNEAFISYLYCNALYHIFIFTFLFLNIYFSFLYSLTSEDCKLHSFTLSYLTFYVICLYQYVVSNKIFRQDRHDKMNWTIALHETLCYITACFSSIFFLSRLPVQ